MVVHAVLFMPRLEIEYLSVSPGKSASASEYRPACKPSHKYHFIGVWYCKRLSVKFFVFELYAPGHIFRYGVRRVYTKQLLPVAVLPAKGAGRTHEPPEYFTEMGRMQRYQPHTAVNMIYHSLHIFIRDIILPGMTPPDKHVSVR